MAGDSTVQQAAPAAESRWPMAAAVLTAMVLQLLAPQAGRLAQRWVAPLFELLLLGTLIACDPGRIDKRSRGLRQATTTLIAVMTVATLGGLTVLMVDILWGIKGASGAASLFGRGAALWVTNVIVFSLWYWQFDRGGPAERAAAANVPPELPVPGERDPGAGARRVDAHLP